MSDRSGSTVRSLFEAALELPEGARRGFLDGACGGDAARRDRVERLLAAHAKAGDFLAAPAVGPGGTGEEAGARIGPYSLVERIGEGGFGTVFLAEQGAPIRRRVALKIIKLGMDTRAVIARFEQERQALALMDHPSIARVLDAGATASGRPYFVMELVSGQTITSHCDAAGLGIRERLELFRQVCQAVQHAHQKGIIHRDLKPSNVLVAEVDGRPTPKIIDFGIAKATAGGPNSGYTLATEQLQMVGTPQYMSPEQVEGSRDIDTRSDVYSLGVLLYELLTGCTPVDALRLRSVPLSEVQRIIREEEPPRPSTRVTELGDAEAAHRRATEPARLAGALRSDLDWIVMKCLEKERSRRYETANALAMDIGRYLAGEPVLAAPPGTVYLARKFLRRNQGRVVAAGLVVASLLAAVAGTATFAAREARQRALAEERANETAELASFQAEMLAGIDVRSMGDGLRADILEQAKESWRRSRRTEEEIDALARRFAGHLDEVNFTTAAMRMLDRKLVSASLADIESKFGSRPRLKAHLLHNMAAAMRTMGQFQGALAAQQEARRIFRETLDPDDPTVLAALHGIGRSLVLLLEPAKAEPYIREALERRERVFGPDHRLTLDSRYLLGYALQRQERDEEAEPHLRGALEGRRRVLPEDDPAIVETVLRLGQFHMARSQLDEAAACAREGLERAGRTLGPEAALTALALSLSANVSQRQGRWTEAESLWRRSWSVHRRTLGDDHRDTLFVQRMLGALLLARGRVDEAEPILEDALRRAKHALSHDSPDRAALLESMAQLRLRQGAAEAAAEHFRKALAGLARVRGPGHFETLAIAAQLADVLDATGRATEAQALRAWHARAALAGFRQWRHDDAYPFLFHFYSIVRKLGDGGALQSELIQAFASRYGPDDPRTLDALGTLAWHALQEGRLDEAESLAQRAVDGFRAAGGTPSKPMVWALRTLGLVYRDTNRIPEAIAIFDEIRPHLERDESISSTGVNPAMWTYRASCLVRLKQFGDAEHELVDTFHRRQQAGRSPRELRPIIAALADLYDAWHTAEPTAGHDGKAAQWRARLDDR